MQKEVAGRVLRAQGEAKHKCPKAEAPAELSAISDVSLVAAEQPGDEKWQ